MPPVGRPRTAGKLRDPFAGLLARRGVDTAWLVARLGVSKRRAESWVHGERRPAWPDLVLQRIDALR